MKVSKAKNKQNPFSELLKDSEFKQQVEANRARLSFAEKVYKARINKKYSQAKLAKLVGSTQKVISRIEKGYVNVGLDLINRLAKTLETEFRLGDNNTSIDLTDIWDTELEPLFFNLYYKANVTTKH